MANAHDDNLPPLCAAFARVIPDYSWVPAGMEVLPPGWVNVRLWGRDELGRDIYITEACPGIVHTESNVTEIVFTKADVYGNFLDDNGEPYDTHPVVVDTVAAHPPHLRRHDVGPDWLPVYHGGGYVGTVPGDQVPHLLAEHGFADAIPRPRA